MGQPTIIRRIQKLEKTAIPINSSLEKTGCRTHGDCIEAYIRGGENGEAPMNRIGIFVDVQNIYYTTRQVYGRQFNYRKLWEKVSAGGEIVIANAYAIDAGDERQLKFQNALKHIGFNVRLKPYIQRRDGSAKGDWDVGIAIDVLDAARNIDTVVLLSGDGDFDLLLERVKTRSNITAEVFGVKELTSNSLIKSASFFHPIEEELLL